MEAKLNNSLTTVLIFFFLVVSNTMVSAQEKNKKQLKNEQKLVKQKQIALLVESKEFVFAAIRVIPQSGSTLILTAEFNVEFHANLINSFLPFIGRGFSGVGYGGDEGMKFTGKPLVYQIEKTKKGYQIKVDVRGKIDYYSMMLNVYNNGSAYLTIISNNRSPVSYEGEIQVFDEVK